MLLNYMKRCSVIFKNREMPPNTILQHHFSYTTLAKIIHKFYYILPGQFWRNRQLYIADGTAKRYTCIERNLFLSTKMKYIFHLVQQFYFYKSTVKIYTQTQNDKCMRLLTVKLFIKNTEKIQVFINKGTKINYGRINLMMA